MKVEYNSLKYYLITPKKLDIATYKIMQYDNQKGFIKELQSKMLTDSTLSKQKDKDVANANKLYSVSETLRQKSNADLLDSKDKVIILTNKVSKRNNIIYYLSLALAGLTYYSIRK